MQHRRQVQPCGWAGFLSALALVHTAFPATAQITPDTTLGNGNNSIVLPNGNRIEIRGGLQRNSALFQSFEQFNVNPNEQVYFLNPAGVRNIFSRVTGNSVSNIDGLLGVAGSANLFFMNPNGIIFGPNARLDVAGSFLATTASVLDFGNGQKFAATGTREVPLVEVNIPIGLQYGANPPAMIMNRGVLAAGQDLTLAAENLDLQGQLQAGRNLTLQAQDTVKIRDTVTEPFVARSGGDMTIQGNQSVDILALNHPAITPFISAGNLSLVSDGVISGDAHFVSGGAFTVSSISGQATTFMSLFDPIISAAGNVNIAAGYTGPSLLIEALGSVQIQGNVVITGPDIVSTFITDPDPAILTRNYDVRLAAVPGLLIRSGQPRLVYGGTSQNPPAFTNGSVPAGITILGGINTGNDGLVVLDAANGPINLGSANFATPGADPALDFSIASGLIEINTSDALIATGAMTVRRDGAQRAGDITIGNNRQPSSVTVAALSTRNLAATNNGGGGNITVRTTGAFGTTGAFNAVTGALAAPDITNPDIFSIASEASAGDSGEISIISSGGPINLANRRISSASNFDGRGGSVTLQGTSVNLAGSTIRSLNNGTVIGGVTTGFTPTSGVAGNVTITATTGNINAGSIIAAYRNNSSANSYAIISVNSNQGSVLIDQSTLSTSNLGTYYAGDLLIRAANQINITGNSALRSDGYFGIVDLRTTGTNPNLQQILIQNSQITAAIPSSTAVATAALPDAQIRISSPVVIIDNSQVNTEVETPSTSRQANAGNITVSGNSIRIVGSSEFSTTTNTGVTGSSGDVTIGSTSNTSSVELENARLFTSANGQGNSGNIRIAANQSITSTGGFIRTTATTPNTNGVAGNVELISDATSGQAISLTGTSIDAAAFGTAGRTGSVIIRAENGGNVTLTGSSPAFPTTIFTDTHGSQDTGGISITTGSSTTPGGTITINNYAFDATVRSNAPGNGGGITLQSHGGTINLNRGSLATTVRPGSAGNGGNIAIASSGGQIVLGSGFRINAQTQATNILGSAQTNGRGGNIAISSGSGDIVLNPNSIIQAGTTGTKNSGTIAITGQDITLTNSQITTNANDSGEAGTINVSGRTINLLSSQIQASSAGSGGAGDVTVTGADISLVGGSSRSQISTSATGAGANAGNVTLNADGYALFLSAADVTATSQGGSAGKISITARQASLDNGFISAATVVGIGGGITFQGLNALQMNNTQVVAFTQTGQAGNVLVNANGNINLTNGSQIAVAALQGNGSAGNVTLNATGSNLTLQDSDVIATSQQGDSGEISITAQEVQFNNALVSASTAGGTGGGIRLQGLNTLQMDNSQILASTETGQAGNVTVGASGTISLNNGSQIAVEATGTNGVAGNITVSGSDISLRGGSGRSEISTSAIATGAIAGNVTLNAPGRTVTLQNSDVIASSQQGAAGEITITARQLNLNNGTIQAAIGQNTPGKTGGITLSVDFRMTMENESLISTLGQNGANGGDISILQVRYLLGKSPTGADGSDIIGRADGGGQGGRVLLDRSILVSGFLFRRATPGNRTNDIDTNGQLLNFSTDAEQGTRGLSAPVLVFNDVSELVTGACEAVGAKASASNSGLQIAGRGGVPSSPTAVLSAQPSVSDWVSLELSPQVPVGVTFSNGSTVVMNPGETYELQSTCANAWKLQQQSNNL